MSTLCGKWNLSGLQWHWGGAADFDGG